MVYNTLDNIIDFDKPQPKDKCVVRVATSMWADKTGAYMKKSIKWLKRKSSGYMILPEDIDAIGVEEVLPRVIGLDSAEDGIYEIVVCNEYRDWESGYVEDYDYKLIPYEEEV